MRTHAQQQFHGRDFAAVTGWSIHQDHTPFVIPNLERDSQHRLVLTAALGQYSTNPEYRAFHDHATQYWSEVHTVATSVATTLDLRASAQLERLCSFPERPELRMGYSTFGHSGSGVGNGKLGALVRDTVLLYSGLRGALCTIPDALQLIPSIGGDRVTDTLASILLGNIVRFTQRFNPYFDRRCLQQREWADVYDGRTHTFGTRLVATVPTDDHGRPILLLPKALVRGSMALDSYDFAWQEEIGGKITQLRLGKRSLLDRIGYDESAITHFASARLRDIRPHTAFQAGTIKRRSRRT